MLGNPTAYQIVKLLMRGGCTPSAIAAKLKVSVTTVLRHLREIDLVRYENLREGKVYFIEDSRIVSDVDQLEISVTNLRSREF